MDGRLSGLPLQDVVIRPRDDTSSLSPSTNRWTPTTTTNLLLIGQEVQPWQKFTLVKNCRNAKKAEWGKISVRLTLHLSEGGKRCKVQTGRLKKKSRTTSSFPESAITNCKQNSQGRQHPTQDSPWHLHFSTLSGFAESHQDQKLVSSIAAGISIA